MLMLIEPEQQQNQTMASSNALPTFMFIQFMQNYFVFVTSRRDSSLAREAEVVIMEKVFRSIAIHHRSTSSSFMSWNISRNFSIKKPFFAALSRVVPFIVHHHTRSQLWQQWHLFWRLRVIWVDEMIWFDRRGKQNHQILMSLSWSTFTVVKWNIAQFIIHLSINQSRSQQLSLYTWRMIVKNASKSTQLDGSKKL